MRLAETIQAIPKRVKLGLYTLGLQVVSISVNGMGNPYKTIDLNFPSTAVDPQIKKEEVKLHAYQKLKISGVVFELANDHQQIDISQAEIKEPKKISVIENNKHLELPDSETGRTYDITFDPTKVALLHGYYKKVTVIAKPQRINNLREF